MKVTDVFSKRFINSLFVLGMSFYIVLIFFVLYELMHVGKITFPNLENFSTTEAILIVIFVAFTVVLKFVTNYMKKQMPTSARKAKNKIPSNFFSANPIGAVVVIITVLVFLTAD